MSLSSQQTREFAEKGHLTVAGVFTDAEMDRATADAQDWAAETLAALPADQRAWYVERGTGDGQLLRKLDNPVAHREVFRALAGKPALTDLVRGIVGAPIKVYFSQIFFKPPGGGGPKPVHQDNYYFGPSRRDGMVTAWIALDDADVENGCLYYGDGTNLGPVYDHIAPEDKPFDLQIPAEEADRHPMTPAPVARGGVSFHHGNTLHQSSDNRSDRWRRACAVHYVNADTVFANPALPYDASLVVDID